MQKTEQKKVCKTLQKESGIFKMASTADAVSIQLNISTIISGCYRCKTSCKFFVPACELGHSKRECSLRVGIVLNFWDIIFRYQNCVDTNVWGWTLCPHFVKQSFWLIAELWKVFKLPPPYPNLKKDVKIQNDKNLGSN